MKIKLFYIVLNFCLAICTAQVVLASENLGDPKDGQLNFIAPQQLSLQATGACQTSPIAPPKANDTTFVADCGSGLDTGCTFRSGGPLVIKIPVGRVVGEVSKLKGNNLISKEATLQLPAFDVDFFGGGGGINPERDRVLFNGHVVPTEFLTGDNNVWKLNEFKVPIEWVNFPTDPGIDQIAAPVDNTIEINIDTANSDEMWCTSIDWSSISIEVARPVVMAHGILSDGSAWDGVPFSWISGLSNLGIPNSNNLNMGNLDSIQNNAIKIGNEVSKSKDRWGVDKVNIVAHSKGGLDSRHFVENDNSVERVIQLGTPNAGSPLADIVQGLAIGFVGLPATGIINSLAGPAGVQLTRPYMGLYNFMHGHNAKIAYTALAGDYDPDCLFCLNRLLIALAGQGDTIVPISSVHALAYTDNRLFSTVGGDIESTHTSIEKSSRVFNLVQDQTRALSRNVQAAAFSSGLPVARTLGITGEIRQGEKLSKTIVIDQATPAYFSILFPSGDLDLALISPSGKRFDANTIIGNPNVTREESEILGGRIEVYSFSSAEVGLWTIEISAPSVTESSGVVNFGVNGWLENPSITFKGGFEKAYIHSGETFKITGTVTNNLNPIIGVNVSARIVLPDNSSEIVILRDNGIDGDDVAGDGIYTSIFNKTSLPGTYKIRYEAIHDASGALPAFSREDFSIATVSRSSSKINEQFSDSGEDSDNDGLYNSLVIDVTLDITKTANYHLLGILEDNDGNTTLASLATTLTSGINIVKLHFDGEKLYEHRVDGPYILKTVLLSEEEALDTMLVDEYKIPYLTTGYNFRQFQHAPVVLTGNGSSIGVDTNGNNLFDSLHVNLDVEVLNAGTYTWSARLTDINETEIGFFSKSNNLSPGINTIDFSFDGKKIGENGIDGPYNLRGLIIFGSGSSLVESKAFTTSSFHANQFEDFKAINHLPVADAGPDQLLECTSNNSSVVTLDGSASIDPDGDLLNFSWSGAFGVATGEITSITLPLGLQAIKLDVDDSKGGTDSDTVNITIKDTRAPETLVALKKAGKVEEKKGLFRIEYSCTENCGSVSTSGATINGIPVTDGQLVKLEIDKKLSYKYQNGLLKIKAPSFSLVATCIDSAGNSANASVAPKFKEHHTEDEEKQNHN